jgi:hypothetical protein
MHVYSIRINKHLNFKRLDNIDYSLVNEQKTIKLLMGSTYNLYTLDHKLVGKMDIIDIKSQNGICNIHWIDKYPQKLL